MTLDAFINYTVQHDATVSRRRLYRAILCAVQCPSIPTSPSRSDVYQALTDLNWIQEVHLRICFPKRSFSDKVGFFGNDYEFQVLLYEVGLYWRRDGGRVVEFDFPRDGQERTVD